MNCRHCNKKLGFSMLDLGSSPPSNSFLSGETINHPEKWYPLNILVCENCWLVQTEDFVDAHEMFSDDYAYFSSYSVSFLNHCESFVSQMIKRFDLTSECLFVEVAANDGYLLQYVMKSGIPCYGVEPTESTAKVARSKGIKIIQSFFGEKIASNLASKNLKADFMCANNVLAHVPDINDFLKGFKALLNPTGVATFENPHLLNLINENQFDTVYHEHYSYLSATSVDKIFTSNGLTLFDVQEIPIHGGSLRYFAQNSITGVHNISESVKNILNKEKKHGVNKIEFYQDFQLRAEKIKMNLLSFLIEQKNNGKKVVAYGAAAKGNTLLNYCGIKSDLLEYIVDNNPSKQNMYAPGSRIPIYNIDKIKKDKPDFILILPWNLKGEIISQLSYVKKWKAKFVTVIPSLDIFNS